MVTVVKYMFKYEGWCYPGGRGKTVWKDLKHPADIAGTKDAVDAGESVGVGGGEVGSQHAILSASPPEITAGGAAGGVGHA